VALGVRVTGSRSKKSCAKSGGSDKATDFLSEHADDCAISVVTRAEVLAGFKRVPPIVRHLLDRFLTHGIDVAVADAAAALRQTQGLKLPDAFQLAIARAHALNLVTRNSKDFPARRFEDVVIPYRVS
jgi:predicted nucleic acid-binding protein